MLKMLLIRPGATELDQQRRIKGSLDVPVCIVGTKQIEKIVDELRDLEIDALYAGPCLSAQQTAEQLSRNGEIKIKTDENLKNLNRGLWSGKPIAELKKNQPKLYKQWQENPESICPPDGETINDARARGNQLLKKIKRKHKKGLVAIVASEPLASIFKNLIDESQSLGNLWEVECNSGSWEWLQFPSDVIA